VRTIYDSSELPEVSTIGTGIGRGVTGLYTPLGKCNSGDNKDELWFRQPDDIDEEAPALDFDKDELHDVGGENEVCTANQRCMGCYWACLVQLFSDQLF
jgi:hypothetical protein